MTRTDPLKPLVILWSEEWIGFNLVKHFLLQSDCGLAIELSRRFWCNDWPKSWQSA